MKKKLRKGQKEEEGVRGMARSGIRHVKEGLLAQETSDWG
jgi:hypothetical protein